MPCFQLRITRNSWPKRALIDAQAQILACGFNCEIVSHVERGTLSSQADNPSRRSPLVALTIESGLENIYITFYALFT